MNNIHDNYFKHVFGHPENVVDFIKAYLPSKLLSKLDLKTLILQNTEFLPDKFNKKGYADLLYSVKMKDGQDIFLFLHLEHQSTPDGKMVLRIVRYQTGIIGKWLQIYPEKKVPPIFTFVVYHGKEEWKGARRISDLFTDFSLYKMSLEHTFLIDLNRKDVNELKKHGLIGATEIIFNKQPSRDISAALKEIVPLLKIQSGCCKKEGISYMAEVDKRNPDEFLEEFAKFDKEGATKYTTMFERAKKQALQQGIEQGMQQGIEQGMQQGIEQGMQQGIEQGMRESIQKGMQQGILTSEQVKKLKELLNLE